jgi:hypothetical protein
MAFLKVRRGEAYLALNDGKAGETEFQKLIDHSGTVLNFPSGSLAHLGLTLACLLLGTWQKPALHIKTSPLLWKDADPDIPILKEARAEYAKLQ